MTLVRSRLVVAATAVLTLLMATNLWADTFGGGTNQFMIAFVTVGDTGNPHDTSSPYGGVEYTFRIGTYEVSRDMIAKANAEGGLNISMFSYAGAGMTGGDRSNRVAAGVSWNEAARFVNWLNEDAGYSHAYKFSLQPGDVGYAANADIELWTAADTGYDPGNLYRNSAAQYFLPSENEWYKAAYYSGGGATYYDYATQQDIPTSPTAVASGTTTGTAVYNQPFLSGPADIYEAGGLSHYGTMGQNGNLVEWNESAKDGINNVVTEDRAGRSGYWTQPEGALQSFTRFGAWPTYEDYAFGLRVAAATEAMPKVTITEIGWSDKGAVLQWQATGSSLVYMVESCTNLPAAAWSQISPTSQWWTSDTVWTNTGPTRTKEFFRVIGREP